MITAKSRAHSCDYCRAITLSTPRPIHNDKSLHVRIFGVRGLEVEKAAKWGCDFFAWARTELLKDEEENEEALEGRINDEWEFVGSLYRLDLKDDGMWTCPPRLLCHWLWKGKRRIWKGDRGGQMDIVADEDDPAAQYILGRPLNHSRSLDSAFSMARGWLRECMQHHEDCSPARLESMPTRVIEIEWADDQVQPRLRIRLQPSQERYVALSYCWGGEQAMKTTTSNVLQRRQKLDFFGLPRTIQDAIHTTRKLSLRMLWVDSLCIIQDDLADKAREIAMMPNIYQNAHLTISAACASNSEEGFLQNIVVPSPRAVPVRLAYKCHNGSNGSAIVFSEPGGGHHVDPTETRAWTLQESFLSCRVLRYGAFDCGWRCREAVELDNVGSSETQKLQCETDRLLQHRLRAIYNRSTSGDVEVMLQQWIYLVEDYTKRALSQHHDRLTAISALARFFGEKLDCQYAAGIWLKDLSQLLWTRTSEPAKTRPSPSLAPSWSWASIDASSLIEFRIRDEYSQKFMAVDPTLKLISLKLTPADDLFSASIGGHLELEGLVRQAWWVYNAKALSACIFENVPGTVEDEIAEILAFPDVVGDVSLDPSRPELVWCLQVCSYQRMRGPYGLVLKTEDGLVWRRVGVFENGRHWEYNSKDQRISCEVKLERWIAGCEFRKIIIA